MVTVSPGSTTDGLPGTSEVNEMCSTGGGGKVAVGVAVPGGTVAVGTRVGVAV